MRLNRKNSESFNWTGTVIVIEPEGQNDSQFSSICRKRNTAAQNVCFWHKADMAPAFSDIRSRGKAAIAMTAGMSAFNLTAAQQALGTPDQGR